MKFIIGVIVFLISLILTGLVVLFGIDDFTGIHFRYWLIGLNIIIFTAWKFRFRTEKRFRYFLLRNFVIINRFFRRIDKRIYNSNERKKIGILEEKSVRLWKLSLKDKDAKIYCSIANGIRQIEKNNMIIILTPITAQDYLMTIMDLDNASRLYEIALGRESSETVVASFDLENEKRMRHREEERKNSINDDLDKLLFQQEQALKKIKSSTFS